MSFTQSFIQGNLLTGGIKRMMIQASHGYSLQSLDLNPQIL